MKKVLSAAQMRALDEKTIEHYGVPSLVLMERAALAVCDEIMIGENDGSALVPVKEDLGLHAVQTELNRNVDRFGIRLG